LVRLAFWLDKKSQNNVLKGKVKAQSNTNYKEYHADIKVVLYEDRIEIRKLGIIIPYSSLDNDRIGMVIGRIIQEISRVTGIPGNEILLIKSYPGNVCIF
jgi:hypothetical protein